MEWAYTRLIKGMVLEEKQRCVMNNIVEGWYLLLFNNIGLQLMTLGLIAIISISRHQFLAKGEHVLS